MSMFESLGRYGAALKHAHNRHKSVRALNSLPAEHSEGHRLARVAGQ